MTNYNSVEDPGRSGVKPLFTFTFHIEWLRIVGLSSFCIMMATCYLITTYIIFPGGVNADGMKLTDTAIYQLFGFNHSCNVLDFDPAKLIASLMLPFMTLPLIMYLFLFHCKIYKAWDDGLVSKNILNFSRVSTIFNIYVFAVLHLWFVNGPEDKSYGFKGHYIPYLLSQIALGLMAIRQVAYLAAIDKVPFGVSTKMAWLYVYYLVALTIACQFFGIATAWGNLFGINPAENEWQRILIKNMGSLYMLSAFAIPIIFAYVQTKNGHVSTITLDGYNY